VKGLAVVMAAVVALVGAFSCTAWPARMPEHPNPPPSTPVCFASMSDTTPSAIECPVPPDAIEAMRTQSRQERIDQHWIPVKYAPWWDEQIAAAGLPGAPLKVRLRDDGSIGLSRADVFELARPLASPNGASDEQLLALLWNTLAWGTRAKRAGRKRILGVANDHQAALDALRAATSLASTDPAGAYDVLYPGCPAFWDHEKPAAPPSPDSGQRSSQKFSTSLAPATQTTPAPSSTANSPPHYAATAIGQRSATTTGEVVPGLVELEVAVPRSRPAVW
jgi:hypothetical protein